jgi:hypothetical protein
VEARIPIIERGEPVTVCPQCEAAMTAVECQISSPRYVCRVGAPVPPARTTAWWLCGTCGHAESRKGAETR